MFLKGTAYLAAAAVRKWGDSHVSEGYGLQAVRKCFAMNPALAAEGRLPLHMALFPQPYQSCPKGPASSFFLTEKHRHKCDLKTATARF